MKYPEHSLGRVLVEGYRMASWKLHCTVFLANATLRKTKTGLICKLTKVILWERKRQRKRFKSSGAWKLSQG